MDEFRHTYFDMRREEKESMNLFRNVVQYRKWSMSDYHRVSSIFENLAASEKKIKKLLYQLEYFKSLPSDVKTDTLKDDNISDIKVRIREEFAFLKATHNYLVESINIMSKHDDLGCSFIVDLRKIENRINTLLNRMSGILSDNNNP